MKNNYEDKQLHFKKYTLIFLIVWLIFCSVTLLWVIREKKRDTNDLILAEARAHFKKDRAFRLWGAMHGGVYVPQTEHTPPNPNLKHIPERDITTPFGINLTLMNPAYMLRQMMEDYSELYGIFGRLTSLKPIRKENAPDKWEIDALKSFEKGSVEKGEFTTIKGKPFYRYMSALETKKGCLKCHGVQGYKVGDIRGGIGISLPISNALLNQSQTNRIYILSFGLLWLIGTIMLIIGFKFIYNRIQERELKKRLQLKEEKIRAEQYLQIANAAKKKAEESDHLKSAFLANMSHEIRTPMNHIIGFTSLLEKTPLNEKQKRWTEMIRLSGDSLLELITDIVDLSKIDAKQLEILYSDCPLENMLNSMYEINKEFIEMKKKNIILTLQKPTNEHYSTINTDPFRLKQILTNLLSNAFKFTLHGSIEFGYLFKKPDLIEFYVKDSGIGIPKDKQELIFQRFTQADNASNIKYQGTGLGLAISKGLVNLLGGEIAVESKENKGARFYFTLPYYPIIKEHKETKIVQSIKYNGFNKLILLVEDDELSTILFKEILTKVNHQVLHTIYGEEAVEYCNSRNDIALVLMDIKLPKMNGIEAIKQIKQIKPDMLIITLTAYAMHGDRERCLNAGANDYLSKPIKEKDLTLLLAKYLKEK